MGWNVGMVGDPRNSHSSGFVKIYYLIFMVLSSIIKISP